MRSLSVEPVILPGRFVRLEPLDSSHCADLAKHWEVGIHEFFSTMRPAAATREALAEYIGQRQRMANQLSFAVIWLATGEAIGCTSYLDIRASQLGLEIGMTWYGRAWQGTKVNPEAKLLLLSHAFDVLGCESVQLKTDSRNFQSQAAISKLGAVREGVLRNHRYMPPGIVSDTVMYSILPREWPNVRAGLEARISG